MSENLFLRGSRSAYRNMMTYCLQNLGVSNSTEIEIKIVKLISEREDAISTLRSVCEECGDNYWPDELHLSDIIEKHLARYLYAKNQDPKSNL